MVAMVTRVKRASRRQSEDYARDARRDNGNLVVKGRRGFNDKYDVIYLFIYFKLLYILRLLVLMR